MKRILVVFILLLCIMPLAMADEGTITTIVTSASTGEPWILNANYSPADDWSICAAYNKVPQFSNATSWTLWNHVATTLVEPANWNSTTTAYYYWDTPAGVLGDPYKIVSSTYTTNPLTKSIAAVALCNDSNWYVSEKHPYYNSSIYAPPPNANFTGAPLDSTAPAYVAFTDTSTNETGTCTYNWSFTPADGVLAAPGDLDNEDITMLFTENGNFTIIHGVSCAAGSNISTKTDYVHIYNATALSTFRVRAVDAISGYGINGAGVDVYDIENTSWTNQTSVTGEVTVSALTGHTINAYGSATGYDDGESLALPVVAGSLYPIYMWPTSTATNVSAGNVTVYVTVLEDGTNTRLSGYSVSLSGPSSGGADYTSGITNENGIFQATIKNQTNYNVKVLAQKGHLGANKNFYSGNQSGGDSYVEVTLWLGVNTVTTAPTVTTLPGGGTPTPTVTYLANCDPSASDYDAAKCRSSKGGFGLNILADNLEWLIYLCLIVTAVYLLKGMGR